MQLDTLPADKALLYGLYQYQGLGLPRNEEEGLSWIVKASHAGSERATIVLEQLSLAVQAQAQSVTLDIQENTIDKRRSLRKRQKRLERKYVRPIDVAMASVGSEFNRLNDIAGLSDPHTAVHRASLTSLRKDLAKGKTTSMALDQPKPKLKMTSFVKPFQSIDLLNRKALEMNNVDTGRVRKHDDIYVLAPGYFGSYDDVLGSLLHFACMWGLRDTVKLCYQEAMMSMLEARSPGLERQFSVPLPLDMSRLSTTSSTLALW